MDTTKTITHVSLCAGYGGIDLGLHRAVRNLRTIAVSEIEAFACANLVAKMEAGLLDPAPIWTDLKTFPWAEFRDRVDILSGGYPCQPFSAAGKRLGAEDPRHLWPFISAGIAAMRPSVCFFETSRDISALGYPTFCKTWQDWVTERRGAWRARVNAARLTRGKGISSWPTISVNESKNSVGKSQLDRNSIPLGTMAAWTTPTPWQQEESLDSWETRKAKNKAKGYNGNGQGTPLDMQVKILGQADLASSSSLGSRQGLSWATPATRDTQGQRGAAANARKGNPLDTLPNQMAQWGTPTARDHKSGRGNEEREYKELTPMVERQQSGKLNPRWVETLMGLPIGWTMPSCTSPVTIERTSCDSSGMALCRPAQSERSDFLLAS